MQAGKNKSPTRKWKQKCSFPIFATTSVSLIEASSDIFSFEHEDALTVSEIVPNLYTESPHQLTQDSHDKGQNHYDPKNDLRRHRYHRDGHPHDRLDSQRRPSQSHFSRRDILVGCPQNADGTPKPAAEADQRYGLKRTKGQQMSLKVLVARSRISSIIWFSATWSKEHPPIIIEFK